MIRWATETITWVKVDKPTFNLAGVVVGSLALAAILAAAALALGLAFALLLIRRNRSRTAPLTGLADLGPQAPPPPS